ncbi:hypothetical protein GQ54DRAFT_258226 [Martensiomyces pterosporus]|nr:hypothetical protein GQ54DRAFT_258226 [Martensiomyces pterosporus]
MVSWLPIVLGLFVLHTSHCDQAPANKRAVSVTGPDITANITSYSGGLLIKNGVQTTCEVVLIDQRAAFVAANCFDYEDSGKVSNDTAYEVYLQTSTSSNNPAKYLVALNGIHIHPSYNTSSLGDNIAIVEFNKKNNVEWHGCIAVNRTEWDNIVYVRRTLNNVTRMDWNAPASAFLPQQEPACVFTSTLYTANKDRFLCNSYTLKSIYNDQCSVPFGSVLRVVGTALAPAALYSYTSIYGQDLCSNDTARSYYTVLENYIGFAVSVLKRPVRTMSNLGWGSRSSGDSFAMNTPTAGDIGNMTVFGGDVYSREGVNQVPAPITTGAEPSSSSSSSKGGLTKTQTIGVAVGTSLGSFLLAIGAVFGVKRWKRYKKERAWDPDTEMFQIHEAANQLGGANEEPKDQSEEQPPAYSQSTAPEYSQSAAPVVNTDELTKS